MNTQQTMSPSTPLAILAVSMVLAQQVTTDIDYRINILHDIFKITGNDKFEDVKPPVKR